MSKKTLTIIVAIIAIIVMGVIFSTTNTRDTDNVKEITTTIVVINDHESRVADQQVKACDGVTVREQLILSGIEFEAVEGYVTSIMGVKADKKSGWVFEVNDQPINVGYEHYLLKADDKVTWKYVTWDM